jgi:hypothetical protein
MKKLLFLIVLAGACYGLYNWFESYSGDAIKRTTEQAAGGQLVRGQQIIENSANKIAGANLEVVRQAVGRFKEANGRNPASLQELVDKGALDSVPAGLNYDPVTGEVTVAP